MSQQSNKKVAFGILFVLALLSLVVADVGNEESTKASSSSFSRQGQDTSRNRGWLIKDFLIAVAPAIENKNDESIESGSVVLAPQTRVIDPDHLLNSAELEQLEAKVKMFEESSIASGFSIKSKPAKPQNRQQQDRVQSEQVQVSETPVQLAVVLMNKMDLLGLSASAVSSSEVSREEWAAEHFATTLHDRWGVGYDTTQGGTGIVIFLSLYDRVLYVSRGGAVEPILTDTRVDRMIVTTLRPFLRSGKYGQAMEHAIDDILQYLEDGPPQGWEWWRDEFLGPYGIPIGVVSIIAFMVSFRLKQEREERREYAMVSSQLSQIDRAQAEVLQGRYQATSCPICFEDFKKESSVEVGGREGGEEREASAPAEEAEPSEDREDAAAVSTGPRMLGSDGLPLKLLRCGHVFDESCWAEWVTGGSGDVTKCPICKKDVGDGTTGRDANSARLPRAENHNHNHHNQDHARRQPQQANNGNNGPNEDPVQDHHEHNNNDDTVDDNDRVIIRNNDIVREPEPNRAAALAQFHRERNFRLYRLANRFPRYIQQQQLQRWTQSTYDGSLVRDPTFVRNDPRVIQHQHRSSTFHGGSSSIGGGRSGSGFSSFGGGSSSGGRSGRW